MPQYLVAIYHPDDYDPSTEDEPMMKEIHALNREMMAAGAPGSLSAAIPQLIARDPCGANPMAR